MPRTWLSSLKITIEVGNLAFHIWPDADRVVMFADMGFTTEVGTIKQFLTAMENESKRRKEAKQK